MRTDKRPRALGALLMTAMSGYTLADARDDREFWGRLVESAAGAHLANAALDGLDNKPGWD